VSAVASITDEPNVFALDVGCHARHSEKFPDRLGHVHHWGASLRESKSPECGLIDSLITEGDALGLVPLDAALPVELAADDRVILPVFDFFQVRGDGTPWPLAWPLC